MVSFFINFKIKIIFGLISNKFASSIYIWFTSVIDLIILYIKFNSLGNLGLNGIRYLIGIFFGEEWLINNKLLSKKLSECNSINDVNFWSWIDELFGKGEGYNLIKSSVFFISL